MPTQCCMESWRKIFIAFSECRTPSHESFSVLRHLKFSHSTNMLCHLHWLPVQYRIQFKLPLLAFNARNNNAPLYLSCLLHNSVPGRSLRSSQSNLLCVPLHKLNFGARSFRIGVPTVWNSLPADIRACTCYGSFIRQLNTYFSMLLGP